MGGSTSREKKAIRDRNNSQNQSTIQAEERQNQVNSQDEQARPQAVEVQDLTNTQTEPTTQVVEHQEQVYSQDWQPQPVEAPSLWSRIRQLLKRAKQSLLEERVSHSLHAIRHRRTVSRDTFDSLKDKESFREIQKMAQKAAKKEERNSKKVSFFDFKGLMAPVLSCFHDDNNCSLDLQHIDKYAKWLKNEHIGGVLVNSITGEGPALGLHERKIQLAAWWRAACDHDLILMAQIGGAPLPDVYELAQQAEELGVHAVLCLPELFYKPRSIEELVGYCKIVSKKCTTRPFFYYHIPRYTNIDFDMEQFCRLAEQEMPNFFGLQFSSSDLEMGIKCLREGRVILLGSDRLLASGLLLGFESALMSFLNVRPDLGIAIMNALQTNNLAQLREKQNELNRLMSFELHNSATMGWVSCIKQWFNDEFAAGRGPHFTAGPIRKFF